MTAKAEQLKMTLAKLPAEDRAALAHFLIRSLDPEEEKEIETAWDVELQRRAEEIRSGKAVAEPAESVFRELRAKYS
jgi:putative addiction module component (TIGR02574 family)